MASRRVSLFAKTLITIGFCAIAATLHASAIGYGKNATGGAGGPTVTVNSLTSFLQYATASGPYIIQVSGTISGLDNSTGQNIAPNKTIIGVGTKPTILGVLRLYPSNNVIIQNLNITGPNPNDGSSGIDGITIKNGAHDIWVDHCTFTDCADGEVDITYQSDNVTISWCKFQYTFDHGHDFVDLIGASDTDPDTGKLHVTVHHCWFANLCKERMPRVRFGRVHVFNNYYGSAGNNYNVGIGNDCQVLLENSYFDSQSNGNTWKNYSSSGHQGLIHWSGLVLVNTTQATWAPNSTVFTPPYSYTLDAGSNVKSIVTNSTTGAGAH